MGDGFYRSKDPTNSIKVLKEKTRTEVAGAGSWRGGRVKETGTDND